MTMGCQVSNDSVTALPGEAHPSAKGARFRSNAFLPEHVVTHLPPFLIVRTHRFVFALPTAGSVSAFHDLNLRYTPGTPSSFHSLRESALTS